MTTALTVYRQSALKDSDCLYRVKAVWKDGVEDSSDFALIGQAFHLIKHLYVSRLIQKKTPQDLDEALAAFVEGIAQHQTPNRLIPELREMWVRHTEVFALDVDRIAALEYQIVLGRLSGTLDLVYAHPTELEVVDDKTFWTMLTDDEVKNSFQARVYTLLARAHFPGFHTYRFTFAFVRFNKVSSVVFTQADLDQVELEANAAIARIEEAERTGSWPANVGPSCRYCQLKCPIADQEQMLPVRFLPAQAQQVAAWLIPAEKKMSALKKALKQYCVANGPVVVNGLEWANRPVQERKYPLGVVLEILKARNILGVFESTDGATISYSALSKLFRQFPALEIELQAYVQSKVSYRFSAKKPGDDGEDAE